MYYICRAASARANRTPRGNGNMKSLKIVATGFPAVLFASAVAFTAVSVVRADDMPAVGQAAPGFTLNSQEGKAVILGVSVDSVDSHQQFCTKESLTFKLLSDESHAVVAKYGSLSQMGATAVAARNTFLIDPKGIIRKVYVKVSPNPHSEEVLAALAELQKSAGE